MKKIVFLAALAPALALAACGDGKTDTVSNSTTTQVLDNGTVATTNTTTAAKH